MISGVWLYSAARCSGVPPALSRALGSAPALTRAVTVSGVWLNAAAACSNLQPLMCFKDHPIPIILQNLPQNLQIPLIKSPNCLKNHTAKLILSCCRNY